MQEQDNFVAVTEVILAVVFLILVNVLFVYCCRRIARRDLLKRMNEQIES
jgi:ABC-type nitrate/sulfonate/bicarbonate transport system permease component